MNKFIAQLQDDTGVTPEAIVDSAISVKEVTTTEISAVGGFDVSGGSIFTVDLSAATGDITVASLKNMVAGKIYTFIAYNGASAKHVLSFTGASLYPASLTLANGNVLVYKVFTDGTKVRIYQANFAA